MCQKYRDYGSRAQNIESVDPSFGVKIDPQYILHIAPSILSESRLGRFHDMFLVDGVFLFFVLSGFLIGGILIKLLENNKATIRNLFNFWIRRWFRTIPNYFLILVILVAMRYVFYDGLAGVPILHYFLFIQNFHTPHPLFFSEAWTLSVEEWFYLLIPSVIFFLVGVFKIVPKKAVLTTAVAVIIASIGFRLYRYGVHPVKTLADWDLHFRKEVITRLDSLMFGVLGAYCAYYYKSLWARHKIILFWIGLGLVILQQAVTLYIASGSHITQTGQGLYLSVFSFPITATGILLLLPLLSEHRSGSGFIYESLTHISIASYSMYLIHVSLIQPLVLSLTTVHTSHVLTIFRYCLYWALTIVGSIMLYKYFEKPTTDMRDTLILRRKNSRLSRLYSRIFRRGRQVEEESSLSG